jgi:hypothetical protein
MKRIVLLLCIFLFAADSRLLVIDAQPSTKRALLLHQFGVNRPARVPFDFAFFNALRSAGVDLYVETTISNDFLAANTRNWITITSGVNMPITKLT